MAKLSEKIAYGFGDMASSMFWKIFSYYLPIFYSDVFGLKPEYNLFNLNGYQKVLRWNCLDPLLGYSREDTISGFYLHGEDKENVLRIVTLGGATTDFSYSHIKSWPQFLHEMLLLKGIENAVYNGGMNGYTSCEEREKMRREWKNISAVQLIQEKN